MRLRLRLLSAIGISLVVALVAVFFDRVMMRGLGLDGTAVVVIERPPQPALMPPPPPPTPANEPCYVRPSTASSATAAATAAEIAAQHCEGRCDTELAGWRRNMGNLAFGMALEICVRRRCVDHGAPFAPPEPVEECSGGADDEERTVQRFEQAVRDLRERNDVRACATLEKIEERAPCGSIWREKAANLRGHRCDLDQ